MKRSTVALSFLAVIIFVLAFFQTPVMAQVRLRTWNAITVVVARLGGISDAIPDDNLNERLQQLTADNLRLKAELVDWRRLRDQLSTPPVDNMRPVPAAVVARPVDTLQSELILSQGLSSGVSIGDPVVVFGSNLVGVIVEAQLNTSRMRTLYHPEVFVTVEIINEDEGVLPARGLLQGLYYSSLEVTTIPRDIPIEPGQSIVTITDGEKMPYGLVIGSVESVESRQQDAYQSTRVSVPYDVDTIDSVSILTQP